MTDIRRLCHDRILPKDMAKPMRLLATHGPGDRPRAIEPDLRKLWINGSTLQVRFMGGTEQQRAIVREQADWWSEYANIRFNFNNAIDADIRISFDPNDGAWSYIGTDAKSIPRASATMNLGFLDGGTAGHEFGHALGLGHEHQSPNNGMQWNEAVVLHDLSGAPNFWTPEEIRHNVLDKYEVNQYLRGTAFDGESIMLYWFPPSWTTDGQSNDPNEVLSTLDKSFIKSDMAYPRQSTNAVKLQVDAANRTEGKIGKPGEEDLYQFAADVAGPYVIETWGKADVVMKLFGPDSQTALIAEDDDSGIGLNSKIVAELTAGNYFAQIRHYNKAKGTGAYTIGVNKG